MCHFSTQCDGGRTKAAAVGFYKIVSVHCLCQARSLFRGGTKIWIILENVFHKQVVLYIKCECTAQIMQFEEDTEFFKMKYFWRESTLV